MLRVGNSPWKEQPEEEEGGGDYPAWLEGTWWDSHVHWPQPLCLHMDHCQLQV